MSTASSEATLTSLTSSLAKELDGGDVDTALDVLSRLAEMRVTAALLQRSAAACRAVAAAAKHRNDRIRGPAAELAAAWKAVVRGASTAAGAVAAVPPAGASPAPATAAGPAPAAGTAWTAAAAALVGDAGRGQLRAALAADLPALDDLGYECAAAELPVLPARVRPVGARAAAVGGAAASAGADPGARAFSGSVLYWMSRDMRVADNWALTHAAQRARAAAAPLVVVACVDPADAGATLRATGFLLRGLRLVEADLARLGVPFRVLLGGDAGAQVAAYAAAVAAVAVVADFSPLRGALAAVRAAAARLPSVPFEEVDAHNVVPAWAASPKLEVGARTLRGKLHAALPTFLTPFPRPAPHPHAFDAAAAEARIASAAGATAAGGAGQHGAPRLAPMVAGGPTRPTEAAAAAGAAVAAAAPSAAGGLPQSAPRVDWPATLDCLAVDAGVPEVTWAAAGERGARDAARAFLTSARLARYADRRNDPTVADGCSGLSPWLRFGHVSAQRVVLELARASKLGLRGLFPDARTSGAASFAEELVVRRELADNFCLYQPGYDGLGAAAGWARDSLAAHARDARDAVYTTAQFEAAATHEALWNACQMELAHRGKLHGFCRMYWAKKVLEWSASPAEALATTIYLNDRYSLDGRDPNGFAGCAWSIMGTHDMGWAERPVFGKIRYMNLAGCKRKFDVALYVSRNPVRALARGDGSGGRAQQTLIQAAAGPASAGGSKA